MALKNLDLRNLSLRNLDLRKKVQIASLLIHNGYLGFLFGGSTLYQGIFKNICAPGLNCHSCPSAFFACPIGVLQNILATPFYFPNFLNILFYIVGFLLFWAVLFGRFICGWLCPFGFIQELLYKIPHPKFNFSSYLSSKWGLNYVLKFRIFLKSLVLVVFVFLFPVFVREGLYGVIAFCKYLCPAGTLEASLPQIFLQTELLNSISFLFYFKLAGLLFILLLCIMEERFFCKFICPLGLIYGVFNRVSFLSLYLEKGKCALCKECKRNCSQGLVFSKVDDQWIFSTECIRCLECKSVCPKNAIRLNILR